MNRKMSIQVPPSDGLKINVEKLHGIRQSVNSGKTRSSGSKTPPLKHETFHPGSSIALSSINLDTRRMPSSPSDYMQQQAGAAIELPAAPQNLRDSIPKSSKIDMDNALKQEITPKTCGNVSRDSGLEMPTNHIKS